jgi:ribosome biogenesis protein MAK21
MFQARPDWHAASLPDLPSPDLSDLALPVETTIQLKKQAIFLLETDNNLYSSKNLSSTSSHRFLSTIMSSGTLSDKVSALTLVIQESPVHTMKSFESLLSLAKKRSRGQAVTALGAIKDLLGVGAVLPPDRRLRTFESQPGLLGTLQASPIGAWKPGDELPGRITTAHMVSWAYEDWLKETYFDVLKVLEAWCNDEVVFARGRAVTYVYELLREKPEQESNLLRLLVNKLGDPDKKIASRTSYLILQLQTTHPLMKPVIIRAIETELLLRPGQSSHAKYYAINTLNQTILSGKEEDVARKLLSIYFDLFVILLKNPGPQKAVAGPLVNRKGQIQGGGGQVGKKAKEKAKKEEMKKQDSEETIEKMISAVLTGVNRAYPFAKSDNVTYGSWTTLKITHADWYTCRLEKHMDTLFKITHSSNFNTSVQALILIQHLATSKHLSEDRFYRTLYESLLDPRLITSSKHAMYLNLLFRALKSDLNVKRVKGFAKRLLQVITLHQPPFVCGVLYLLRELEGIFPGLSSLYNSPEEPDEMDEEIFLDVPEETVEQAFAGKVDSVEDSIAQKGRDGYDGRKRDPEHSNADRSCLWELVGLVYFNSTTFTDAHVAAFHHSFPLFCFTVCVTTTSWKGDAYKARFGFTHTNSFP